MGFVIRSIRMKDHFDLCPKVLCDECGSTIDCGRGTVIYFHQEPYATKLRFFHSGPPCMPPPETIPPGWHIMDLAAFIEHFMKFNRPETLRKIPFRLQRKEDSKIS